MPERWKKAYGTFSGVAWWLLSSTLHFCLPLWGCFLFECGGVTARGLGTFLSIYSSQRVGTSGSYGNGKAQEGGRALLVQYMESCFETWSYISTYSSCNCLKILRKKRETAFMVRGDWNEMCMFRVYTLWQLENPEKLDLPQYNPFF